MPMRKHRWNQITLSSRLFHLRPWSCWCVAWWTKKLFFIITWLLLDVAPHSDLCCIAVCFRAWNSHAGVAHRQQIINTHLLREALNVFITVFPLKPQICGKWFYVGKHTCMQFYCLIFKDNLRWSYFYIHFVAPAHSQHVSALFKGTCFNKILNYSGPQILCEYFCVIFLFAN